MNHHVAYRPIRRLLLGPSSENCSWGELDHQKELLATCEVIKAFCHGEREGLFRVNRTKKPGM